MRQYQTDYIANTEKVIELMRHAGISGLPTEEIAEKLREKNAGIRGLREENSRILREKLFPLLDNILTADEEELRSLEEFADNLYRRQLDAGIRYYVCRALVSSARVRKMRDFLIKELYMTGMALHEFQRVADETKARACDWKLRMLFGEAAGYIRYYDEIEDTETRGFIHRAMGNIALGIFVEDRKTAERKFEVIRRSLQVLTDPVYQQKTPGLPWELYIYKTHQERTTMLSYLRSGTATSRDVRDVLESAQYVYDRQMEEARKKGSRPSPRWLYAYYAASYHCGIHSLPELLLDLEKTYAAVPSDDYGSDGMYGNLFLPLIYSSYVERDAALLEKKKPVVLLMYRRQLEYLKRMPKAEDLSAQFYYVRLCLENYLEYPGETSFREYIGQMLEGRYPEIHVHSRRVARLSGILLRGLLQENPAFLLGVRGITDLQELRERQRELERFLYDGSVLHDIGKLRQLELYETPNRGRLTEEEEMYCNHAAYGAEILRRCPSTRDYAVFALGHHRWYNGGGGYPEEYRREETCDAALVDIVSVADFLEERCDPLGDYHTDIVSWEEALEELRAGSGTRFAPEVVEVCKDISGGMAGSVHKRM
ncbi:MAG: HD domain-containing protein [Roseburia sp.]|nr:HD domain-containing protein [Roseburia sp.]MCM1097972.1 HD domain-containing protein [Ruminococcus flavefaciens]